VEAYGAGLEQKPEIVALSKADAVPKDEMKKKLRAVKKAAGTTPLIVSVRAERRPEVLRAIAAEVRDLRGKVNDGAAGPEGVSAGMAAMRPEWTGAKRLVVKIGSSLLVDTAAGTLRQAWLEALADDIAALRKEGKEIVVVSSGAIALGRNALKLPKARSARGQPGGCRVGQIDLAHAYEEAFRARSLSRHRCC